MVRNILALAGLAITLGAHAQPAVEIQLHETASTGDDYLCWNAVPVRMRTSEQAPEARQVSVSTAGSSVGVLEFSLDGQEFSQTVDLMLPAGGAWTTLKVRGLFPKASSTDKDTAIEVREGGEVAGRLHLMVRVRKDAQTMSKAEIARFLGAMRAVRGGDDAYAVFQRVHGALGLAGHSAMFEGDLRNFAFLSWHRQFLLHLERLLQQHDPSVALPYWRFNAPAPNVFSAGFMGETGASGYVRFDAGNALFRWEIEGVSELRRAAFNHTQAMMRFDEVGPPPVNPLRPPPVVSGWATFAGFSSRGGIETFPHNSAHGRVGGFGEMSNPATAVRDPIFFLLHAMVDRVWARWQWYWDKFNPQDPEAYPLQGEFDEGQWVREFEGGPTVYLLPAGWGDEPMWPWTPIAEQDRVPGTWIDDLNHPVVPFAMPVSPIPNVAPLAAPTPVDLVDLWGETEGRKPLGFCYDDVPGGRRTE